MGSGAESVGFNNQRSRFIRRRLALTSLPEPLALSLYLAHPASRLSRLSRLPGRVAVAPPYWAYPWAGGAALCHHIRAYPELVKDRRVFDLGAGSGLVAIMAARCGAGCVIANETDLFGAEAVKLNAAANHVAVEVLTKDRLDADPPETDIVFAGDVFYNAGLAARALDFLKRCQTKGIDVLVGDPGRASLPTDHLRQIAHYPAIDFGANASVAAGVFSLRDECAARR